VTSLVRSTVAAAGVASALASLSARYVRGVARADREWSALVARPLRDLGEVGEVSILPVVERLVPDGSALKGEPGLSYLIRAGDLRLLFDTGLSGAKAQSALRHNAELLGVDLRNLDAVVISHLHADHVGGVSAMRRRTFAFAAEPLEAAGVPAHVPTGMQHPRADVVPTTGPRVIAPGVAVLPPVPRMMFWLGYVAEQALVVNVRGFGLVLISGCGHPYIERILGVTQQVLDIPIGAVVGGLHLPVHPIGTALMPQAVVGNPNPPWRPLGERDVGHVMDEVESLGPAVVALSGHDSTPWTFTTFSRRFGDRYRTLRVGEELRLAGSSTRS
jgi:7,8-dihydropterin-6-yl-methyl-4-(beta-D-ribofuranosyl)aminobenzene 5'-phosphate synthase